MVFIYLDGLGVTRCRDVCLQLSIMDGDAIYLAVHKMKKKIKMKKYHITNHDVATYLLLVQLRWIILWLSFYPGYIFLT